MKILRIASFVIVGILFISLILGNIFYSFVRSFVDKNYIGIELTGDEANKLKWNVNLDYNLTVYTDKITYNKFEKIKIFARIIRKKDNSIPENSVIEVVMKKQNNVLKNLDGKDNFRLNYNKDQQIWIGYWYPNDLDLLGNIEANAVAFIDSPEAAVSAETEFHIDEVRPSFILKKGIAFIGIDSLERISKRNIISAEGKEVDWNYIPEWLNFISADGVIMLGGITKTFQEDVTLDSPWDNDKVNESILLAEKLKQKNKTYGVWIKGLKVEGIYTKKMGYKPALYAKDDKYNEDNSAVSILDETRKKNIIKLFTTYMDNDNISYVGLSDIFFPGEYGIELMDRFIVDFQISVPKDWNSMDFDSRFRYFLQKIMKDPLAYENFVSWKKYIVSEYLKDIIAKSGHKKPVFYNVDYKDVLNDPDIISILLNSGIDFIVINFNMNYLNILDVMDSINKTDKIARYFNRLVVSYYIDYKNMEVSDFDVSAIDDYVYANLQISKNGSETLNACGIMINDLYKAMFGKRGPYSPYEWMLGIGETIFRFKEMNKVIPIDIDFITPDTVTYGQQFNTTVSLLNVSSKPIMNFKIDLLPPNIRYSQKGMTINVLQPGKEIKVESQMLIDTNASQFVRKKNIIGIRFSWADNQSESPISKGSYILLKSVNVNQAGELSTNETVLSNTVKTNQKLN